MSYKIERGGVGAHQRFLKNPDYPGSWPKDTDFTTFRRAHAFENENEAHKWVRENEGEGRFTVIDSESGEQIDDSRGGFDSTVRRYIDPTGGSYPGQSDWSKG
jgi:hypothetical protein